MTDSPSASAGDNFLFSQKVPTGEIWEILFVTGFNATRVSTIRFELLDPAGNTKPIVTHHQGRITNFDYLEWEGNLFLDEGWTFRVLVAVCTSGDSLDGIAIWRRHKKR